LAIESLEHALGIYLANFLLRMRENGHILISSLKCDCRSEFLAGFLYKICQLHYAVGHWPLFDYACAEISTSGPIFI